jgi:hypothetical protein
MSQRRALLLGAGTVLIVGLILLALAAAADRRATALSLDAPTGGPAAVLSPGGSTCEGPLTVPSRISAVTVWTSPAATTGGAVAHLRGDGAPPQSAPLTPVSGEGQFAFQAARAALGRPLGPGRLTVCISWRGPGRIILGGSSPTQLAIVFDRPDPPSLLGALPAALRRAALFHPGWVGAWTFWALLGGLLGGLLLVLAAARRSL